MSKCGTALCQNVALLYAEMWHSFMSKCGTLLCRNVALLYAEMWQSFISKCGTALCRNVTLFYAEMWYFFLAEIWHYFGPKRNTPLCRKVAFFFADGGTPLYLNVALLYAKFCHSLFSDNFKFFSDKPPLKNKFTKYGAFLNKFFTQTEKFSLAHFKRQANKNKHRNFLRNVFNWKLNSISQ